MDLYEVQTSAHHGTNQSIWIDVDKICSVEQQSGKAKITFIGGSYITVTCFQSFREFVDAIVSHANTCENYAEFD